MTNLRISRDHCKHEFTLEDSGISSFLFGKGLQKLKYGRRRLRLRTRAEATHLTLPHLCSESSVTEATRRCYTCPFIIRKTQQGCELYPRFVSVPLLIFEFWVLNIKRGVRGP